MTDQPTRQNALLEFLDSCAAVLRIAFNNGLAAFYLSMLLVAIGLCCVRALTERIWINGKRSAVLNRMMQLPQEPLRPDPYPMLSSAVLGEQITRWTLCGTSAGAGAQLNETVAAAQTQFWNAYEASLAQPESAPPELVDIKQSRPFEGVKAARTEKTPSKAALTLPSGLVDFWPIAGKEDPARLAARVRAAGAGLERISPLAQAGPGAALPAVIRFFFISVDGFMRYAPSSNTGASALPPHRTFNHASYVLEALSGSRKGCGDAYETVPYFDILGGGVVMTTCTRTPKDAGTAKPAHGVLCADVTLPRTLLVKYISENPLIRADFVVLSGTNNRLHQCTRGDGGITCHGDALRPAGENLEARVKMWLAKLTVARPSGYAGASQLTTVDQQPSEYAYAAVLWRDTLKSGAEDVGLVLFDVPAYTFDLASWVWLIASIVCLALLIFVLARARITIANSRMSALQRGLSVGVVRVDEEDGILGVNDRAEFLIGHQLPRLGLAPRKGLPMPGEVKFKDLVEEQLVVVRQDVGLTTWDYEDLAGLRNEGVSSEYWVKLNDNGRWLRVTGAPVFEPDDTPDKQATVGLIEPAEPSLRPELQRALNDGLRRRNDAKSSGQ